jgi:hypothetical protein
MTTEIDAGLKATSFVVLEGIAEPLTNVYKFTLLSFDVLNLQQLLLAAQGDERRQAEIWLWS